MNIFVAVFLIAALLISVVVESFIVVAKSDFSKNQELTLRFVPYFLFSAALCWFTEIPLHDILYLSGVGVFLFFVTELAYDTWDSDSLRAKFLRIVPWAHSCVATVVSGYAFI
ncbi:hypothetical protein [Limnobacter sp. MED105]|uniref:hypothetical protein n=1 Tax=Limnobacter sp. MED105 TaxID=391597 RepID=UPI000156C58E|nr:hypothetical protein [Limnobacter sp. MED105]EDM82095.1 hypothetical protein LMED105_00070 [Limnobacter sp. MED105]